MKLNAICSSNILRMRHSTVVCCCSQDSFLTLSLCCRADLLSLKLTLDIFLFMV